MGNMRRIKAFCPSAKMSFRLFLKHRIFSATLAIILLDIEMYEFYRMPLFFDITCGRVRVNRCGVQFSSWGFRFLLPSLETISWCSNSVSCQVARAQRKTPEVACGEVSSFLAPFQTLVSSICVHI